MKQNEIKKLNTIQNYLAKWLYNFTQAQNAVPFVQANLEITDWKIKALESMPDEANEIPFDNLATAIEKEYQYLPQILPQMPEYNHSSLINLSAVVTSGSSDFYEYISRVSDLGTDEPIEYSVKFTELYHIFQEAQDRVNVVRRMIEELKNSGTLRRFNRALNAYQTTKAGGGERTAAAMGIRTLIYGIQGDLFAMAYRWPKENMTWAIMAERLAKGAPQSEEYQQLIKQDTTRSSLIARLSDIGKDRDSGSFTNLDNVWTQVLDYLYTILGLAGIAV